MTVNSTIFHHGPVVDSMRTLNVNSTYSLLMKTSVNDGELCDNKFQKQRRDTPHALQSLFTPLRNIYINRKKIGDEGEVIMGVKRIRGVKHDISCIEM